MGILVVSHFLWHCWSQGRATLHPHLLIWLKNAPTSEHISALLHKPEFQICMHMCQDLSQGTDTVQTIPWECVIAIVGPPNPNCDDDEKQHSDFELQLARTVGPYLQVSAEFRTSWVSTAANDKCHSWFQMLTRLMMKMGSGSDVWICEWLDPWSVGQCVWWNNDGKLLPKGEDTKAITECILQKSRGRTIMCQQ